MRRLLLYIFHLLPLLVSMVITFLHMEITQRYFFVGLLFLLTAIKDKTENYGEHVTFLISHMETLFPCFKKKCIESFMMASFGGTKKHGAFELK